MAITRGWDWLEVRRNIHLDSIHSHAAKQLLSISCCSFFPTFEEAQILNHFKPHKRVEVLVSQGMFKSNGEPPIMAVGFPEVHSVGVNLKFLVCMRMLDGDKG